MSIKNKIALLLLTFGALFLVFALWYKYEYSMDIAVEYEVNKADLQQKLLIATQGSEFKNAVTKNITDYYNQDSTYIKVIDVSSLEKINPENFNAIVVIHTWENWKAPEPVKLFIDRTKNYKNKIIVLSTSGKGTFKIEGVDAITGESKLEDSESFSNQIINQLASLLHNK